MSNVLKEYREYALMVTAIVVIALAAILSDGRVFGESNTPTPGPTMTTIVIMPTPTASIEDQLNALHNQLGGTVPSFQEYKSSLAKVEPVAVPDTLPKQSARPFEAADGKKSMIIETPAGQVQCTRDAANKITLASKDSKWIDWFNQQDTITQGNIYSACGV